MAGLPLAHAFGKRYDLPVPLVLFVFGGAAVVFVSFLVVLPRAVSPEPRERGVRRGGVRRPEGRRLTAWSLLALVVTAALIAAGWLGSQTVAENIVPTIFWLLVWVAVPISCGVIGNWTQRVNPFAAMAILCDRAALRRILIGGPDPVRWPAWLGYWPAVVLFFLVACGELIFNGTATLPAVTATGLLAYLFVSGLAGLLVGAESWVEHGELFSVLLSTWGRLGWWRFGAPGRRGPLGGLGGRGGEFEVSVSRITFVLLLLVSVSFDGLLSTDAWKTLRTHLPFGIRPGSGAYLAASTLTFVLLTLLAWLLFGGFAAGVRAVGRFEAPSLAVLGGLMASLLPIAFGYLVAHNAEYLVINGQLLIPLVGNPLGFAGVHLLPAPFNDSYELRPNLLPSAVVWYSQVALIIAVHIAAVVLAHRYLARAARTERLARRSEWPWIVAMVGYTMTSLWLLAQPLVQEGGAAAALLAGFRQM